MFLTSDFRFKIVGVATRKKLVQILLPLGLAGVLLQPAYAAKPTKGNKETAVVKTAAKAPAKKKPSSSKDDDETPASKKSAQAALVKGKKGKTAAKGSQEDDEPASKTAKNQLKTKGGQPVAKAGKLVVKRAADADDEEDAKPNRRTGKKGLVLAQNKKDRPLSKAQKLAAARQAEEEARQEKIEAERAKRLAAVRREKQQAAAEAARQQRLQALAQQAQPAALPEAAPTITSASSAMQEEDLIALQIAKHDTEVTPADAAATVSTAPPSSATAPQNAISPVVVPAASALAAPVAAPVVAKIPAPEAAPAPRKEVEAAPSVIRVSIPPREASGAIQGLSDSRLGAAPSVYSNVAYVMDQNTGQVLLNKNGHFTAPIASITKLMAAVITMDANLPMDEPITITEEDVDRVKRSRSRLAVGTTLSRQEMLHLALMSSENRAAHALGRTYPGGLSAAIRAMNQRALLLGMRDTYYVEPTGLSSSNQSSAHDLAQLVKAAYRYPLIRNYTTYPGAQFPVLGQMTQFNNTNRLIHSNDWNIGLQKTGYISEAGRCVVMQSNIGGRNVIIVLLDSAATNRRVEDAEAIRFWVQNGGNPPPVRDGSRVVAQMASAY